MDQQQKQKFLSDPRGLMIAPAGHGKTYAIADMVKYVTSSKKQLVLTHTHAGISSIRKKMQILQVSSDKYQLDTICGFIQRYVVAFVPRESLLPQTDKCYYDDIQHKAVELFRNKIIQKIVAGTYSRLYVDEYQDCTIMQHLVIESLADLFPTHLFGDPLQAIFNFGNNQIVNFNSQLSTFTHYEYLEEPWRWKKDGNCEALGQEIFAARKEIEATNSITLQTDLNSHLYIYIHDHITTNNRIDFLRSLGDKLKDISTSSTLIIMPPFIDEGKYRGNIYDRISMKQIFDFANQYVLLEALDANDYYKMANEIDLFIKDCQGTMNKNNICAKFIDIFIKLSFKSKDIRFWLTEKQVIKKRGQYSDHAKYLANVIANFIKNTSLATFYSILQFFYQVRKYKGSRPDLLASIHSCVKSAINNNKTIYQEMVEYKNRLRHIGRKVEGRCFGTTLLTKGLEFDTVVLLHADRITSPCDFYVAISRACKNLYIFTEDDRLTF